MIKRKFVLTTTIPLSLIFFKGQIKFLKKAFDIEIISSSGKLLNNTCKNEGVKCHVVEMKRSISILNDLKSLWQLIFKFKKIQPEIVHGSTPKAGLLSMIAAWITNVPIRIYYIHGLRYQGAYGSKRRLLMFMEKISCMLATDIFAVSNGVKNELIKDKITNKRIKIIGNGSVNGIDTQYFSPSNPNIKDLKQYNIKKDDFIFGFIGRLVTDKGINELVTAFLNIQSIYPKSKLLLVGKFEDMLDPLDSKTKNQILKNKNIIYAGFQQDIRPYLKMMDVFVFPSYREGFGISLMEAAAMGVPSISSDITGCNEIILNNYNGILVPAKSVSALKNAMIKMIEDSKFRNQLSKNARQHIIEKYEQNKVWQATLKEYQTLLKSHGLQS